MLFILFGCQFTWRKVMSEKGLAHSIAIYFFRLIKKMVRNSQVSTMETTRPGILKKNQCEKDMGCLKG